MDHLDFSSISLDAKSVDYEISGNGISAESTIAGKDGSSTQIVDAWFAFYNGTDADQMAEAKSNETTVSKEVLISEQPICLAPVKDIGYTIDDPKMPVDATGQDPVVIRNFNVSEDKIDISTLIETGACDVTKAIQDFVFSRTENGNTIISVDSTGSGSASAAVDVVVLKDVVVNHVDDIVQVMHQQQSQSGFGTV